MTLRGPGVLWWPRARWESTGHGGAGRGEWCPEGSEVASAGLRRGAKRSPWKGQGGRHKFAARMTRATRSVS